MHLKSAHIRHYKSLDDVQIEFSNPITVLVGPNAAGKSNIIDCLRFVRDAVSTGLEHAVSKRGGIGRIRQYGRAKPFKLEFALSFASDLNNPATLATYKFALEPLNAANYQVDFEEVSFSNNAPPLLRPFGIPFDRNKAGSISASGPTAQTLAPQDQLAFGQNRDLAWPLAESLKDWRYSEIHPGQLREPSTPDKDTSLSEDGRNWASIIKALQRTDKGKDALKRISDAMRVVIPSFRGVNVSSAGSYLVPYFSFNTGPKSHIDFDAVQLSDGTLRIFGILLALYQVPAPKLLLIEEPEQAVHPGVLGVLAEAFREASENTQIIVTTHSPHFVDYFDPEEVRVVSLESRFTKVSRIKRTQIEAVKEQLMSMQDFMLAEGLLPEEE